MNQSKTVIFTKLDDQLYSNRNAHITRRKDRLFLTPVNKLRKRPFAGKFDELFCDHIYQYMKDAEKQ